MPWLDQLGASVCPGTAEAAQAELLRCDSDAVMVAHHAAAPQCIHTPDTSISCFRPSQEQVMLHCSMSAIFKLRNSKKGQGFNNFLHLLMVSTSLLPPQPIFSQT